MQPARERKAPADNLKSWSIPPSVRSKRCRTSFDREFHLPHETNPLRQDIVRRDRVPSQRIARPDRRKVMRFSLAYGDVVNRVSPRARAPTGERTPVACWLRHSAATNFPCYELNSLGARVQKFAMAECHRQHAARVRSPEIACGTKFHSPA